jgi:transcriptional regulator with XRE-family HTH domain
VSENELGLFLRTHREALTPAAAGILHGGRRRTPGLRRSELAMLAGISVEYLARLEQGRDRHPSPQVLAALAASLRLSDDGYEQLQHALRATDGTLRLCNGAPPPARTVRPPVRALLDRLEPTPAVLLNRLGEILARTAGYEQLTGPLGVLDAPLPSLVRFFFTDPRARTAYPDWDLLADELVVRLKADSLPGDPHLTGLVLELSRTAGAPFAERWALPPVLPARSGALRVAHPGAGELRLVRETLGLADGDGLRLVVHLPADEATSAALDSLTGRRPGALRAVAG